MTRSSTSVLGRLALAVRTFFAILRSPPFAERVARLDTGGEPPPAPAPSPLHEASPESALQLLGLLQREARFVDFVEEDIAPHSDADIGAAVRIVHEGCRKVLREYFAIRPVREEAEGSRITVEEGFDAAAIRLTGNIVGPPPFTGSLSHRGWRAAEIRLPRLAAGHDSAVLAPAEVEL